MKNQIIKREVVTPYLALFFAIVAFTGILMFFHLLEDYTNVVHEFLGLTFVLFSILHIVTNRKSIGSYSKNRKFIVPGAVVSFLAILLVIIGKVKSNIELDIKDRLLTSPVSNTFKALKIDYTQAKTILKKNNIIIIDSLQSIDEISLKNKKSPEEIIQLIIK